MNSREQHASFAHTHDYYYFFFKVARYPCFHNDYATIIFQFEKKREVDRPARYMSNPLIYHGGVRV